MLIRLGYDIHFHIPAPVAIVAMLNVHPSREGDLREPDEVHLDPHSDCDIHIDSFGNRCARFFAQPGPLRLSGNTLIHDNGIPEPVPVGANIVPVQDLPNDVIRYLLSSRYCEVDRFAAIAVELFSGYAPGWERVQAVLDWVNSKVTFGYQFARPSKSALDVFTERVGVCRDFQHLAITMCRALNIPARYATGYLGDIGVPPVAAPMDFSAWFEVYLDHRWWACDARHNFPRIGRVLMATGRDASDVAITTSFGAADLTHFNVISDEVREQHASAG